ncbi:mannose-6-phosphate isomerase, class I [Actinocrinis puniceicyclus]|uniref:mannose-6-phosphate isomerase n=1 Tax=Actinocrinis puniceicyclus TaxID=977794 RepID=A0A8J8BA02_9ACTN|nr:mannose-6-phosphate isomerase, class I [Actinocrinis puniceicyclus]MBS2961568.1 mannose-6-phosphate isomerase, class I [Actinocrinis puniceicyclus]
MDLLSNTVQPYAWGSPTAIPRLLGIEDPDGTPQAELWMGAHPSGPSRLARDGRQVGLDRVVAAAPQAELGEATARRFGGRLPFLLKVLAARKALSIQLHPDRAQAEAGFAAERARGVPRGARERVYVDDWPKPEVLCALTPFEVLAGLRPAPQAADVLSRLGVGALEAACGELREQPKPATVARVLAALLAWPETRRAGLVGDVVSAAAAAARQPSAFQAAYGAVGRMAQDHPGDIGLVCSLLMNHAVVQPGQALFMGAGGLHAYIRGTGIELMANSDNVIRAGLTPKHIDIPELMRVLDPEVRVPILTARQLAAGVEVFDTPVPEFRLHRLTVASGEASASPLAVPGTGLPRILLCVDGAATAMSGGRKLELGRGRSCFVPAADPPVTLTGDALVFLASPGE